MIQIVYSSTTGRVRRWYAGASDSSIVTTTDGEERVDLDLPDSATLNDIQAAVTAHCGLAPSGDRYAVVNESGEVVGAVLADPACGDAVEGCELVPSDCAGRGWTLDLVSRAAFNSPSGQVRAVSEQAKGVRVSRGKS